MSAIFSVQNLQTFLRRKNLRPPSRGGPPGPERPPPPPPNRGRSPPPERGPSPDGREGRSATGAALLSSLITLLLVSVAGDQLPVASQNGIRFLNGRSPTRRVLKRSLPGRPSRALRSRPAQALLLLPPLAVRLLSCGHR